jgi:hypothetical protein
MARIEPLNASSTLQHFELIVPDWMARVFPIPFQEIAPEQVLDQVITPINNRLPVIQDKNPLAIDRYSTWHFIPRVIPSYPKIWIRKADQ